MTTKRREYDEDDVRVRATRGSRPRTRTRPRHEDAIEGFVIAVDRGRYTVWLDDTAITAMRARELGRKSVVVGDRVSLVGDVSGAAGALARIVRIRERTSVLRRTADDDDTTAEGRLERVVVANADQLVIVSALADPPPRTGFIDRCLVAAYDAEIEPILLLTKADLATPDAILDYYTALDVPHLLTGPDSDLTGVREALAGQVSVLVGHSGVGKSTLVNRLIPGTDRAVGEVSAVGKGRHTSTSAVALRLPLIGKLRDPGWIIDTPGVRSFGLAHVSADSLLHGFPDLVEGTVECPPNCDHMSGSALARGDRGRGGARAEPPGVQSAIPTGRADVAACALDAWVASGHADERRLASFRRLLASRTSADDTDQTAT